MSPLLVAIYPRWHHEIDRVRATSRIEHLPTARIVRRGTLHEKRRGTLHVKRRDGVTYHCKKGPPQCTLGIRRAPSPLPSL